METKIIRLLTSSDIKPAAQQAAAALQAGGLVAIPTETVYGLAVCAGHSEALGRLRQLKKRPDSKPFTLHIGRHADIQRYLPGRSLFEQSLLKKAWPGPVTVISHLTDGQMQEAAAALGGIDCDQLYTNQTIGIRFPDDPFCRELLTLIDGPVVAPSANFAGETAPTDAKEVIAELNGHIDLIIDAGPTRFGGASTIIDVLGDQIKVLRVGVVPESLIKQMAAVTIVFVCTGNTCRSPMAAGFGRSIVSQKTGSSIDQLAQRGYNIVSAGVMAFPGAPATADAIRACQMCGVDITGHQATVLTVDMIRNADLIYTMDFPHYRAVLDLVPGAKDYTYMLLEDRGVADPIGQPLEVYRQCAAQIAEGVTRRLAELAI